MLLTLTLRNLATISDTSVSFQEGLNVLTGETGAGKSIIIDGLLLALGERADTGLIRPGATVASVEALFRLEDGTEFLVRREVHSAGRSRMFMDDSLVTLEEARRRLFGLVDLHSQRSTPALLRKKVQASALDEFGECTSRVDALGYLFEKCSVGMARRNALEEAVSAGTEAREFARHELELIDALDPSLTDYESHVTERRELERSRTGSELLYGICSGIQDDGGLIETLNTFDRELARAKLDPGPVPGLLEQARIALEEAARACSDRLARIENAPWRLEEIDGRLDAYSKLLTRCGGSIDSLLLRRAELEAELDLFDALKRELKGLMAVLPDDLKELAEKAGELTALRKEASERLTLAVESELRLLAMPDACFRVAFPGPSASGCIEVDGLPIGAGGAESPEYLFSANRGMEPGPLASVASGGELSRMSLALKLALARVRQPFTMIFDEIDSGVGGETARSLADALSRASVERQVVVITHLASIAAAADRHLTVSKEQSDHLPVTDVRLLEAPSDRIEELTRILGGGEAAAIHAKVMFEEASVPGTDRGAGA